MSVVNSALDPSEQRKVVVVNAGLTGTGVTGIITQVPFPCSLDEAAIAAFGLSGAPAFALVVNRFIPGTGFTAITVAVGTSNTPPAYGTSGVGASGMIIGASTVLLANDVLMYQTSVANTAVTGFSLSVVLRPIQDVKIHFGLI